jgi:ATP-dependent Lon protease
MNPILYFDELDKVSSSTNGQDVYSVLSNITDSTVNNNFKDHYFSQLNIDLSNVFYIFTFNDISKINKVLLDRLNVIYIANPSKKDKIIILKSYCLHDILENIGLHIQIKFDDASYLKVIEYTDKQIDSSISSGIRECIRILEKILLEINKEYLLQTEVEPQENTINISIDNFNKYFNILKSQFIFTNNSMLHEHMYI